LRTSFGAKISHFKKYGTKKAASFAVINKDLDD